MKPDFAFALWKRSSTRGAVILLFFFEKFGEFPFRLVMFIYSFSRFVGGHSDLDSAIGQSLKVAGDQIVRITIFFIEDPLNLFFILHALSPRTPHATEPCIYSCVRLGLFSR